MNVLITGATGFVGAALVRHLKVGGATVRAAVRSGEVDGADECVRLGDMEAARPDMWTEAVKGIDAVAHLAARVHVMDEKDSDPLTAYRKINVAPTLQLAKAAASAGVGRFVFVSSIKVNGEYTSVAHPFRADDQPAPADPYGLSKLEAENGLRLLARETGMEVTVVRPPLVYGPGVKANFETMMRWLRKGLPLPLGALENRRSFVALDNLVDLLSICLVHPAAANQTFLVSDGEDLSTTSLLRRLAAGMGVRASLVPVPRRLLEAGAVALGRGAVAQRLCGDLQVDISKTRNLLGWEPPLRVDEALSRTAKAFLESNS